MANRMRFLGSSVVKSGHVIIYLYKVYLNRYTIELITVFSVV